MKGGVRTLASRRQWRYCQGFREKVAPEDRVRAGRNTSSAWARLDLRAKHQRASPERSGAAPPASCLSGEVQGSWIPTRCRENRDLPRNLPGLGAAGVGVCRGLLTVIDSSLLATRKRGPLSRSSSQAPPVPNNVVELHRISETSNTRRSSLASE